MGRRGKNSRAVAWALFAFGLLEAGPGRADAGLSALAFWPAAPMVIATTLSSGLAKLANSAPYPAWSSDPKTAGKLPRVRLLASDRPTFLRLAPPTVGGHFTMTSHMPEPPSFHIENGPRVVVLRPDIRMTNDRRGGFFGFRGTF